MTGRAEITGDVLEHRYGKFRRRLRYSSWRDGFVLAVLSFLPPLFTSRGQVSADTKTYLYLNPGKLLSEATSMWNPNIGNGTVTHQTLGYLWPMGPFYRLADLLGVADWVAQRLWWGLLVFLAAMGTRRVARQLGVSANAAMVAAGFYAFSPYFIQYFARLSGLLLPWVGLPWLMWCVVRARDDASWKWPACFALIIGTVGTVNATSLIMVGIGPVLWLVADLISRTSSLRDVIRFVWRTGVLCVGVSLWWLAGLMIQGKYGLPILRYTESYETVAKASSAQELLRGLGYWFFYGGDKLGRWVGPSTPYLTRPFIMLAGWTLSGVALLSLSLVRSRHKFHFVFVLICALGVAVGAAPLTSPSPYGRIFDRVVHNESGFALRSTPRAAPVVLLILALALAFGLDRFAELHKASRWKLNQVLTVVCVLCIFVNFHPWFLLRSTTPSILRTNDVPGDWKEVAAVLNSDARQSSDLSPPRTYEIPGSDFANYTWGGTIDPITPGLVDGGYIARELVPYGSDATADLLNAYEARLQEGWFDPRSLPGFAEFISANRILMRNDLQHERYRTPRPETLWKVLSGADGLRILYSGHDTPTSSYLPIIDNSTYASDPVDRYPSVVAWATPEAKPLLTTTRLSDVVVVSGSGDGLVDALDSGVLTPRSTVVYRETLRMKHLDEFDAVARSVVTDSNRKAARRWFSVGSNLGRVERADEFNPRDPTDNRLMPFTTDPNAVASSDSQTVSVLVGDIAAISATSFGNQVTYTPEDRPENAFDSDPATAWRAGVFSSTIHQSISVVLRHDVTASKIRIDQATTGVTVRRIEKFRLVFNGADDATRFTVEGNFAGAVSVNVPLPEKPFNRVSFEVLSDSFGKRTDYAAAPGIGVSEIQIPGVKNTEYVRVPQDSSSSSPTFVFTRRRIDPTTPNRFDPDFVLRRVFTTRATTAYRLTGLLRINPFASDARIADLLNISRPVVSSVKADGNIRAAGFNANDGDLSTAWITPLDTVAGATLTGQFGQRGDSTISLDVRTGDSYSIPKSLNVFSAGSKFSVDLPLPDSEGHLVATLPRPLDGPIDRLTITSIRETTFPDYFSNAPRVLPVAVREVYTSDMPRRATPTLDGGCRTDIVAMDGRPIAIKLIGKATDLLHGDAVEFELCNEPLTLGPGEHFIAPPADASQPWLSGWNIDRVTLEPDNSPRSGTDDDSQSPNIEVIASSPTKLTARVTGESPTLLAFAQSINSGWKATLRTGDETLELGAPFVVNGYANGWVIPHGGLVTLEWTPQRIMIPTMVLSLSVFFLCGFLAVRSRRKVTPLRSGKDASWWIVPVVVFVFGGVIPGVLALLGAFLRPRVATLCGALIGGATVGWIVLSQWHYRWPPNLDWPGRFNSVTWLALAFLAVAGTRERTTLKE